MEKFFLRRSAPRHTSAPQMIANKLWIKGYWEKYVEVKLKRRIEFHFKPRSDVTILSLSI